MKTVLVTGAAGFIGKNLCSTLELRDDVSLLRFTRENSIDELPNLIDQADFIFHIAGVNRPKDEADFKVGNQDLTEKIIESLRISGRKIPLLLTSSTQAELDNPYGKSKIAAENAALAWAKNANMPVYIYRLPGVFGKWCKPNYNSVVATFCHNIARNLPVEVSDPNHKLTLVYIDDVIDSFIKNLDMSDTINEKGFCEVPRQFELTLSDLKNKIIQLHNIRKTLTIPNLQDTLNKFLYATYISYLPTDSFSYELNTNSDDRGWLAEFIKSEQFGQVFVSKTKPGVSRGNHWHQTKIEKFLVVEGQGEINFRNKIDEQDVISYTVDGNKPTVLDIPTGYVHSIKNTGSNDLITLFWANEILDKNHPDTYYEKVIEEDE